MSEFHKRFYFVWSIVVMACCACWTNLSSAEELAAQEQDPAQAEYSYIRALVYANMPDLAEGLIAQARQKWPQLAPKLKVLETEGSLRLGKFEEVKKVIASLKGVKGRENEYWALNLSLAKNYYARSRMKECRAIYQEFFKAMSKPDESIKDFYVENAFMWADICQRENNFDEAVRTYDSLLKIPMKEEAWCTIAMANVSLLLRQASECTDPKLAKKREAFLAHATKLVDELLWKNQLVIVFGKAISMKAHIELLRGHLKEAQSLVNTYMPNLSKIHQSLIDQDPDDKRGLVRMSPMPECRYLLAKVLWEGIQTELKKTKPDEDFIKDSLFGARQPDKERSGAGAYNHAINVFVKYPESTWASNAGDLANEIEAFVQKRYNKTIRTNVTPEQKRKVREMEFATARKAYQENDWKRSLESLRAILLKYPEMEESIGLVQDLADTYLNLMDDEKNPNQKLYWRLAASAVEGYLATRMGGIKKEYVRLAGDGLLTLAARELDRRQTAAAQEVYALYFSECPTHYSAPQTAFALAGKAFRDEDWDLAAHYYQLITTNYKNYARLADALQFLAVCYEKQGNQELQISTLRAFAEITPKVNDRTATQLRLALMQQKSGLANFEKAAETNDAAVAEALRPVAFRQVAGSIKDFRTVSSSCTKELAENKGLSAEEKAKFLTRREQALFLEGDSWQRLKWPAEKVSRFRESAVAAFERYLEAYPKGQYGAVALVKIGTIYTAEKNMDASQKAFARLQKDFPESEEAKNSVPRLAKTLFEMGLHEEAVAQYRQMINTESSKYVPVQYLAAGDALLEAKGWDVATEAFAKVIQLATPEKVTNQVARTILITRALLGQAKASVGQKQYAEAHQKLDAFLEKYPKSAGILDANEMLVEVAAEEGRTEKDNDLRMQYFNAAVRAVKKIRQIKEGRMRAARNAYEIAAGENGAQKESERAKKTYQEYVTLRDELATLDLRSAGISARKLEAEESMNLKEQAVETRGRATSAYQAFLMAHEPNEELPFEKMSPQEKRNLQKAYVMFVSLMDKFEKLDAQQTAKVLSYCADYEKYFPNGKDLVTVKQVQDHMSK